MKLKPCPNVLCGCPEIEQLELVQEHSNNEDVFYYQCTVCGCVPIGESSSRKKAIEAWNHRPLEDQLKAHAVEVLAKSIFQEKTKSSWNASVNHEAQDSTNDFKDMCRAEARALLGWDNDNNDKEK